MASREKNTARLDIISRKKGVSFVGCTTHFVSSTLPISERSKRPFIFIIPREMV